MTDEKRQDDEMRRMVEAGKIAARQVLQEFSIHNLNEHDGKEAERADRYHAHKMRMICTTVKNYAMKTTIGAVVTGGLIWLWQAVQGPK